MENAKILTQKGVAFVEANEVQGVVNLPSLKEGDHFAGVVCVKEMYVATSKNGNDYISGKFRFGSKLFNFKMWDATIAGVYKPLLPNVVFPVLATVTGSVRSYQGTLDFTLTGIDFNGNNGAAFGNLTPAHFTPMMDCEALYTELCNFINTELSENWGRMFMTVMGKTTTNSFEGIADTEENKGVRVLDLLKTAWAASANHDALSGGLMAHTLKMLRFAQVLVEHDSFYEENKDLLYACIILHDIGKTQEIVDGSYTQYSYASHHIIGVEFMAMHKEEIVALIGIDNYYKICTVIYSHHDRFGAPSNSIWSYIVHLIDMLDTWATMFREGIDNGIASMRSGGYLAYPKEGMQLAY